MAARTLGELEEYIDDLNARESQLNGFDGENDRVTKGLSGACYR